MNNITIIYGSDNSITISRPDGFTIGQALADNELRSELGFGQNVEGHIGSVPQPNSTRLIDGDRVYIYDKQCSKAAITRVTIVYGTGNEFVKDYDHPVTVEQVLADAAVRSRLGFGQSVEGHLGGVPQPGSVTLVSGDTLHVFDKQCSKARK